MPASFLWPLRLARSILNGRPIPRPAGAWLSRSQRLAPVVLFWHYRKKNRPVVLCRALLFFALALAPALGLVPFGFNAFHLSWPTVSSTSPRSVRSPCWRGGAVGRRAPSVAPRRRAGPGVALALALLAGLTCARRRSTGPLKRSFVITSKFYPACWAARTTNWAARWPAREKNKEAAAAFGEGRCGSIPISPARITTWALPLGQLGQSAKGRTFILS